VAKHPAALECAVVAVSYAKWGQRPKAFVTLNTGLTGGIISVIRITNG
jgi:acyl-coenzyme A synthetase/AMP-(fatty) acid ligase